jgi:hypothetical protein
VSDEVRAERNPEMDDSNSYCVLLWGLDEPMGFVPIWFDAEATAEAFIAKVNGEAVDAADNLPPWPDLTDLRMAVDGVFEHAECYLRGESSFESVEDARANVIQRAIALVERHR